MSIDGSISATVNVNDRRARGLSSTANIPLVFNPSITFTHGVGANQANKRFDAERTFVGTTDDLDLAGTLEDPYGDAIAAARMKAIAFQNTGTADIVIGAHATAAMDTFLSATGTITLPPGAFFVAASPDADGWPITATTKDTILVTGTNGQTYKVAILLATT